MSTTTPTTRRPVADRQAARANRWTVSLMSAPAFYAGTVTVEAPDRDAAWTAANAVAVERNLAGAQCVAQGVALAPLTRTELATVDAFLSGRTVRLRADHAAGLDAVEHRAGRVYVHALQTPRHITDLDPETMARAGDALDHRRRQGPAVGPHYSAAEKEACAIRCAAHDVPEGFAPTGRVAVWGWWSEPTSPTFPDTPEGRAQASRLARLHSGGRASLVLDGVTIATMHSFASAAHAGDGWPGPYGPLLRVLHPDAVAQLGPRAARLMTAVRSTANLRHPDHVPDVETCWTPAELVAAQLDPRDGFKAPALKAEAPTIAEVHPELETELDLEPDDRAYTSRMEAPHERLYWKLQQEPHQLWKLAAENPAYFDTPDVPVDARQVNR